MKYTDLSSEEMNMVIRVINEILDDVSNTINKDYGNPVVKVAQQSNIKNMQSLNRTDV